MAGHEPNVLRRIGVALFGGLQANGPGEHPARMPQEKGPISDGQFSAELLDLISRRICLDHPLCLKTVIRQFEKEIIMYVLGMTHWNQKKAAEILGVKHTTLNYWVRQFGLAPGRRGEAVPKADALTPAAAAATAGAEDQDSTH